MDVDVNMPSKKFKAAVPSTASPLSDEFPLTNEEAPDDQPLTGFCASPKGGYEVVELAAVETEKLNLYDDAVKEESPQNVDYNSGFDAGYQEAAYEVGFEVGYEAGVWGHRNFEDETKAGPYDTGFVDAVWDSGFNAGYVACDEAHHSVFESVDDDCHWHWERSDGFEEDGWHQENEDEGIDYEMAKELGLLESEDEGDYDDELPLALDMDAVEFAACLTMKGDVSEKTDDCTKIKGTESK